MARVTIALSVLVLLMATLIISVGSLRSSWDNHRYKDGDRIPFAAIPYFKLPFCPPGSPITNRRKTLEEVLEGDCFTNTLYQLNFKVEKIEETLCEKNLTKEEVWKFRHAVRNNFEYKMYHNNIQILGQVGSIGEYSTLRYYLTTHIDFHAYYFRDRVEDIYITSELLTGADISDDAAVKVNFTYSVFWNKFNFQSADSIFSNETLSDFVWPTKEQGQGDWPVLTFTIVIWVVVLFNATMRYLSSYHNRHLMFSVQIHGDGCRCPPYTSLLGAILGIGTQQLILVCILFGLAYRGALYPCNYDELSKRILLIYSVTSVVSGYVATSFHTGYTTIGWDECLHQTWLLYLIPVFLTILVFNILALGILGTSDLAQLGTMVIVLFLFGTMAFLGLGAMIGYALRPGRRSTCGTSRIPSLVPQLSWYLKTPAQMFLGGLLPFMLIFRDMDILYASLWKHKVCGAFNTMLTDFIILICATIIVGIVFTMIQLSKRDQQWWWRSVFRGGSTSIFVYAYGIYFYVKANMYLDERMLILFLGYNACICYGLFLILGTIGFHSSSLVFRYIYGEAQKNE
ncbi:hypothetical protein CsSME_00034066 [Camellia sinensis var. sinensis]